MLPSIPRPSADRSDARAPEVKPGSWWRLVDPGHGLAELPAPEHGLVLMLDKVNVIDGEIHSVVLHPHPLWQAARKHANTRYLLADFLDAFVPEPDGEALRAAEIDMAMGRVQAITEEMRNPPAPDLLLEKQTSEEPDSAVSGPGENSESTGGAQVPSVLLPGRDVLAAQAAAERQIAALKAQQAWVAERNEDLKSQMSLVALYQQEKVSTALAGIRTATDRAGALLKNVQTIRLFLGEDCHVECLHDGEGADPSEPLTFLQRMLYLDEEIILQDVLEGFSCDHMGNLEALFAEDFSLVERMLPYPRAVAIARVRRNDRQLIDPTRPQKIADLIDAMQSNLADKRIHMLIRDGARVHLVTVDEATSGAERLFPSRAEIEALFRQGSFRGEGRQITPDMVEYSDARTKHDQRALFYKRFLLLLWGLFERTDIFGPFMDKGQNWLEESIHSSRFRFIHDEEDVLEDGRPPVEAFVAKANAALRPGSRAVVAWSQTATPDTTTAICIWNDYRVDFQGNSFVEPISLVDVFMNGGDLKARTTCKRWHSTDWGREIDVPVRVSLRRRPGAEDARHLYDAPVSEGVLCLDGITLADLDYYMTSRAARRSYLAFHHLMARARAVLVEEAAVAVAHLDTLAGLDPSLDRQVLMRALHLWRAGNKWGWPLEDKARVAVLRLAGRLSDQAGLAAFLASQDALRGGVKANGDIWLQRRDPQASLPDGAPAPWLREETWRSTGAHKPARSRLVSFEEVPPLGQEETWADPAGLAAFKAGFWREIPGPSGRGGKASAPRRVARVPQGLWEARNADTLEKIRSSDGQDRLAGHLHDLSRMLSGQDSESLLAHLDAAFANHAIVEGRRVRLANLYLHAGIAMGYREDGLPLAWVAGLRIDIARLAYLRGHHADLRRKISDLYARPEAVFARHAEGGSPVDIFTRTLSLDYPLHRAWTPDPLVTTESPVGRFLSHYEFDDMTGVSIEHLLAAPIATPTSGKGGFFSRLYGAEDLDKAAHRMTLLLLEPARAFMQEIWATSETRK